MTVHFACVFLDLLWLAGTLNWGQISNSDPRTKNEASSFVHTIVAVYSSSVEQNCKRRFEKRAFENSKNSCCLGHGTVHGLLYGHILDHCVELRNINARPGLCKFTIIASHFRLPLNGTS